jgi:phosphopantetheinyl transferase (holo-ACP synthase)
MSEADLAAYLSRLCDRPIAADQDVVLSSAQKAALAAWLRRNGIADASFSRLGDTFRASRFLTGSDAEAAPKTPAAPPPMAETAIAAGGAPRIGIDVEYISTLPHAEDYRAHPFYADNFSDAEIVYCIQRPNPRQSFCGIWAAKEAVCKAFGLDVAECTLSRVEISRDLGGRPLFPGGEVSISHTGDLCVAVCIRSCSPPDGEANALAPPPPAGVARAPFETGSGSGRLTPGLLIASAALNVVTVALLLSRAFHG